MNAKKSCRNCKYFTDKLGNSGFCQLHRYDVVPQEIVCNRFEYSNKKNVYDVYTENKSVKDINSNSVGEKSWLHSKKSENILLLAGTFSCAVNMIVWLLFGVILGGKILFSDGIPIGIKTLILVSILTFILGMSLLLLTIIRKSVVARFALFIIMSIILITILVNYDAIWFSFQNFVDSVISVLDRWF